jgi:hypothetical protein
MTLAEWEQLIRDAVELMLRRREVTSTELNQPESD